MRSYIIVIALLLSASNGLALDKDKDKDKTKETPKTLETGSVQRSPNQESVKKTQPAWPRPYKSTEEISVDSTVPFPTDI